MSVAARMLRLPPAAAAGARTAPAVPHLLFAALFTAGSAALHLEEWLDTYRDVPSSVPGSAVVRLGFPLSAALGFALAVALVATARRGGIGGLVRVATAAFLTVSVAVLIATRSTSVAGWMETAYSDGARGVLVVEIAAVVALAFSTVLARRRP